MRASRFLRHLIIAAIETYPEIPIVHAPGPRRQPRGLPASIRSGFSSVMMDGSLKEDGKTPATYDYNVDVTRRVVEMAHAVGVSVEGELGCLGSLETGMAGEEDGIGAEGVLTTRSCSPIPEQAADFVSQTGVDALAIAIGTSHGAYKFTRPPTGDILAMDGIKEIHARMPNTHLVMHGSSSVPQEWLDDPRIRRRHPETYGVPVEEIVEGIAHGVRKVNIDTDIRIAMTGAMRSAVQSLGIRPARLSEAGAAAASGICLERFEAFGCAGQAGRIKPLRWNVRRACAEHGARAAVAACADEADGDVLHPRASRPRRS